MATSDAQSLRSYTAARLVREVFLDASGRSGYSIAEPPHPTLDPSAGQTTSGLFLACSSMGHPLDLWTPWGTLRIVHSSAGTRDQQRAFTEGVLSHLTLTTQLNATRTSPGGGVGAVQAIHALDGVALPAPQLAPSAQYLSAPDALETWGRLGDLYSSLPPEVARPVGREAAIDDALLLSLARDGRMGWLEASAAVAERIKGTPAAAAGPLVLLKEIEASFERLDTVVLAHRYRGILTDRGVMEAFRRTVRREGRELPGRHGRPKVGPRSPERSVGGR